MSLVWITRVLKTERFLKIRKYEIYEKTTGRTYRLFLRVTDRISITQNIADDTDLIHIKFRCCTLVSKKYAYKYFTINSLMNITRIHDLSVIVHVGKNTVSYHLAGLLVSNSTFNPMYYIQYFANCWPKHHYF